MAGAGRSRGIALIAALWVLTLLSVIAGALLRTGHTEQRIARTVLAQAEARALAKAGIARAIAALLARDPADPWRLDGAKRRLAIGNHIVTVAIQDELGRIDLNAAEDGILEALFVALGLAADAAAALVDAIGDWRDEDDLRRARGAEAQAYRAAGLLYGPRNGAFESVDELAQVKGMTPDLLERARPALTVLSRRPFVDPATAPRAALAALPGLDRVTIDDMLRPRESRAASGARHAPDGSPAAIIDLTGRVFTVAARVERERDGAERTVAVRFTGDPRRPVLIQDWR